MICACIEKFFSRHGCWAESGHGETGGLERVKEVTAKIDVPVLAIGGITAENVGSVMEAGASGAAFITAITQSPNPENSARALSAKMRQAWASVTSSEVARRE